MLGGGCVLVLEVDEVKLRLAVPDLRLCEQKFGNPYPKVSASDFSRPTSSPVHA